MTTTPTSMTQETAKTFGALTGPYMATSNAPRALVILLHGYGANGMDLFGLGQPLVQSLGMTDIAIWSPNAPDSLPGMDGPFAPMEAYQWFPIQEIAREKMAVDVQAIAPTVISAIEAAANAHDISHDRVVVVGFSQGGMVAMEACLTAKQSVAGVIGLSTAYLGADREAMMTSKPMVTLVHGDSDPVVPPASLEAAVRDLAKVGIGADAHMLEGLQHNIDQRAFDIMAQATWNALNQG